MSYTTPTTRPSPTLSLTQWAEQRLTALYKATDRASLDAAYAAFLAEDATITVNGKHLSAEAYKKQLLDRAVQVAYSGAVEVPENAGNPSLAGSVGLFLHATIDENYIVFGERETVTVTASYNLTIIQDIFHVERVPVPVPFDGRRVSVLTEVSVDKRRPIGPPLTVNKGFNEPQP